jgi:hypothetical protein
MTIAPTFFSCATCIRAFATSAPRTRTGSAPRSSAKRRLSSTARLVSGDAFPGRPRGVDAFLLHVVFEVLLAHLGDLAQGHLAQRDQVALTEELAECPLGAVGRINVAVLHALPQRVRRHVDQLDLVGRVEDAIGDALAHLDAGDVLDEIGQAFHVLDVDGADDRDPGVQKLLHILPALLMF